MNLNIFGYYYKELSKKEIKDAILNPIQSQQKFIILYGFCILFTIIVTITSFSNFFIFFPFYLGLVIILNLVFLLILRVVFYCKRQIENYELYLDEYLKSIFDVFKNYLGSKGKRRDNKKIDFLINRIERADIHFRKFKSFYNLNYLFYMFSVEIIILLALFSHLNMLFLQWIIIIFLSENCYFLTIFMIRSYHFKNLKRGKFIFERIYTDKLNEIYSEFETITYYKTINTYIKEISEKLIIWHRLLCGRYPIGNEENEENRELIYENRLSVADVNELDKFYNLFNSLKINLLNEKLKIESDSDLEILNLFLNNYIEMLDFNIKAKNKVKQRKEQRWSSVQSIIVTIIAVTSLFISVLRSFF